MNFQTPYEKQKLNNILQRKHNAYLKWTLTFIALYFTYVFTEGIINLILK